MVDLTKRDKDILRILYDGEKSSAELIRALKCHEGRYASVDPREQVRRPAWLTERLTHLIEIKLVTQRSAEISHLTDKPGRSFWSLTELGKQCTLEKVLTSEEAKMPPPLAVSNDNPPSFALLTVDDFKKSFDDFPDPFVGSKGIDVVFCTGHSDMEADNSIADKKLLAKINEDGNPYYLRYGNISDYRYLPRLAARFMAYGLSTGAGKVDELSKGIVSAIDLNIDMSSVGKHNVITIGAGNVNSFTRRVFQDFERKKSVKLPLHFGSPSGYLTIVSE